MTRGATGAAMGAFAAAALFGVLARPLLPIDETRYLAVAWEMRLSGDWLVPHLNGALYTHKPPLLFWLINLVWSVVGVSETAARLVAPAFGVAAIGATGLLARRLWPDRPGVGGLAALVLAGFGVSGIYGGLTMFDAMLMLAVVLGVLSLVAWQGRMAGWIGLGGALALGALSKGPVILVHLMPLALLAPLWCDIRPAEALRGVAVALAVGLGIVALWLVPAILEGGPEYRDAVLWSQHAGRVANAFAHEKPWWFFVAALPVLLWPWAWSAGVWRRVAGTGIADRGLRLCAIWGGATLLLFSLISGKQLHYLLPSLPAVALVVARAIGSEQVRAPLAGLLPGALGLALIALAAGVGSDHPVARLAEPGWAVAMVGLLLIGLGALATVLRGAAVAALGLLLAPVASLAFALAAPGQIYDSVPIGALLAAHDGGGVALLDSRYQGEFNFAARLTSPPVLFDDVAAAHAWLKRSGNGVLVARMDGARPETAPADMVLFRNRPYGLWIDRP